MTIKQFNPIIYSFLGKQSIKNNAIYRPIAFSFIQEVDGGIIIYNTLTKAMHFYQNECKKFFDPFGLEYFDDTLFNELIENWVLVPLENDDVGLSDSIVNVIKNMKHSKSFSSFTIMTTTDCNARCFYCYELGRKKIIMNNQTAVHVAKFIEKNYNGNEVTITWFGGEPLYNLEPIGIISKYLRDNGIHFISRMVSNGYLFDSEVIEKAVKKWNLKNIQISLDGTEKVYNNSKRYIYENNESPYIRVISNIGELLKNGIKVNIRLNIDLHNVDNMYELCDFLNKEFGQYSNINVYASLLFDTEKTKYNKDQQLRINKFLELQEYLFKLGLAKTKGLDDNIKISRCMADSDDTVVITPDGRLGKCEHFSESELFGSVYSDNYDTELIDSWKEKMPSNEYCNKCAHYPMCKMLKKCPDHPIGCTETQRLILDSKLKKMILNEYNKLKN